ncbi:hypothetical protein MTR67_030162 [Solanum verrucosum]|uniref:Chromo domain-containing protein n=1 Tax=Solanum verrucosum TaxID=315347 RepID=A0AAF0R5J3_SOLVR|nr:hypothetical protein MTR67_030162 [Solanum verrucosum]
MLKKCIGDPSLILPTESVRIKDNLSYEEIPVQILDRQVRRLRTKDVASVKVLWRNQFVEEATWEAEEDMKKRYPYLFESGGNVDQDFMTRLPRTLRGYDSVWVFVETGYPVHFYRLKERKLGFLRVKKRRRREEEEKKRRKRRSTNFRREISSGVIPIKSSIQMAQYEALYDRQCHSFIGQFEVGEANVLGLDWVQEALDKV